LPGMCAAIAAENQRQAQHRNQCDQARKPHIPIIRKQGECGERAASD
jgi:hypothetical protein